MISGPHRVLLRPKLHPLKLSRARLTDSSHPDLAVLAPISSSGSHELPGLRQQEVTSLTLAGEHSGSS